MTVHVWLLGHHNCHFHSEEVSMPTHRQGISCPSEGPQVQLESQGLLLILIAPYTSS